jgi:N-methylhydantoinase A
VARDGGIKVAAGIDIGGTFTDVIVATEDGRWSINKTLSTVHDYGEGVLVGLSGALSKIGIEGSDLTRVAHGTTVASNAVLEESGQKPALITTAGFRDIIEIGRLRIPRLYDVGWIKPRPLVPRELRFEIRERIGSDGTVVETLDPASVDAVIDTVRKASVQSVAIALINSFANPAHEETLRRAFAQRAPDIDVSISTEVSSLIREVERTSTVIVSAYLRPVLNNYLSRLRGRMEEAGIDAPLFICQSTGGLTTAADAAQRPVAILESGPAAGAVAAAALARDLGIARMISFDMGGTTAKAALIENGDFARTDTFIIGSRMMSSTRLLNGAGHPVQMPAVDLAEVGAGGGSIIRIDAGGALMVGPDSAGATPGPACYGLGGEKPTVTDATVILGYLNPHAIAGGEVPIHVEMASRAFAQHVAKPLGLSCEDAAYAAVQVAAATMLRALRAVSSERGRDSRNHVVCAFGGNGPLFGPLLALQLGANHVIIPSHPGVFSAVGLLQANVERDYAETLHGILSTIDPASVGRVVQRLRHKVEKDLVCAGFRSAHSLIETRLSLRYAGQTDTLLVTLPDGDNDDIDRRSLEQAGQAFGEEHERTYGHRADEYELVELVAVHVLGKGVLGSFPLSPQPVSSPAGPLSRRAYFGPSLGWQQVPVVRRTDLSAGVEGPLFIDETDATCLIPPRGRAELDAHGNIHLWLNDS